MSDVVFRGVRIATRSIEGFVSDVGRSLEAGRGLSVSFVNPHSYNMLTRRSQRGFLEDLNRLDLVLADGVGVVIMVRLLGLGSVGRQRFDLVADALFAECARQDAPIYLLGGHDGVARRAGERIVSRTPGVVIAGVHHGYVKPVGEELDETVADVEASGARVVCIGTGAPLQERWTVALAERLRDRVVITCGGYLDQVLWDTQYFPPWADRMGISWLVRLFREPRRLWRRYLIGNPQFVLQTLAGEYRRRHEERQHS